jgi:hypothetical protein
MTAMTTTNIRRRQADAAILDDHYDDDDDGKNPQQQQQRQCPIGIDRLRYQYQQQQQQQQEVVPSMASSDDGGNNGDSKGNGNDEKVTISPSSSSSDDDDDDDDNYDATTTTAAAATNSNLTTNDDDSLLLFLLEEEDEEEATVFSNTYSNSNNVTVEDFNFNDDDDDDDDKLLFVEEEEEKDFLPNDNGNATVTAVTSSFISSSLLQESDADADTEADTAVPIWNSHQYDPLMMSDDYFGGGGGGDFRRNRNRKRQRRIMEDDASSNSTYYTVPSFLEETFTQQQPVTANRRKEFQDTFAIKLGHGIVGSKRWGHTKNITMNDDGSSSSVDNNDYRMGLISIAIVVVVIVFFWLILLEIFRRLGPKRVGYLLSGGGSSSPRKKGNDYDYDYTAAAASSGNDDDQIIRAGGTNNNDINNNAKENENEDILNINYSSEDTPRWLFPKVNKNKINMTRVKSFFSTTTGDYHSSSDDDDDEGNDSYSSSSSSDYSYSSSSSCSSRSRGRGRSRSSSDDYDEESGMISQSGRISARSTDMQSTASQNDVSTDTSHFYKVGVIRDGVLDVSQQQQHQQHQHQHQHQQRDNKDIGVVCKERDYGEDYLVSLSTVARPQQQQWEEILLNTGLVLCDPNCYINNNNKNNNSADANHTFFGTSDFSHGSKNMYAPEDDTSRSTRTRTNGDDDQYDILRDLQCLEQEQEMESSRTNNEESSSSRLHPRQDNELRDLQHLELEQEISKIQIQQPQQQQQQYDHKHGQEQQHHREIPASMISALLEDGGLLLSQQKQQAGGNHHHNIALEEGVEIWYDLQSKRFFSSSNSCNSNSNNNESNFSVDSSTTYGSASYAASSKKSNKGSRRRISGGDGGDGGQKRKSKYKNYDINGYAGKACSPSHLTSSVGRSRHRQQSVTPATIDGLSSSSASSCNSILDTDDDKGNNNIVNSNEHCNDTDISYNQQCEHRCSRIIFVFAGICIIISGLSMAIFGASVLKESATKTLKVLEQVDGLTTEGINIMDTFLDSSQSSMASSSITNDATANATATTTAGDRADTSNATTGLVDGEDNNNESLYNIFERLMALLVRNDKNDVDDNNNSNNSNSAGQEEEGNGSKNCGAAVLDNLDETIQQVNDYWNNNNNITDNNNTITTSVWKNYVSKLDIIKHDIYNISDSVNYLSGLIVTHHEWMYQIIRLYNILLALFCAVILLLGTNNNNSSSKSIVTTCPRTPVSNSTTKKRKRKQNRHCSFSCWTIPFFIMLVTMSFIASIVFLIGSTALADICIDNPDEQIIQILQSSKQQQRTKLSSLNYDMAIYYVNQCPIEEIPIEFTSTITGELWDVSHIMVESHQIIDDVCSTRAATATAEEEDTISAEAVDVSESSATTGVLKQGEIVQNVACNFSVMLNDLVDLFQCDNWYQLYETGTYTTPLYINRIAPKKSYLLSLSHTHTHTHTHTHFCRLLFIPRHYLPLSFPPTTLYLILGVYDALCYSGMSGFLWVSITQLIIVIMSLIMLTFRIGYNNMSDNNNQNNTMIIMEDEDEDHGVDDDDKGYKNKPMHCQSLRIDKGGRSRNPHPHHEGGGYYRHTTATGEVRKEKLVRSVSNNVIVTASPFDDSHNSDDNDVNVNNGSDTSHMKMPESPKQPKTGLLRQQQQQQQHGHRHHILQQPDQHQFRSSSKVFHHSVDKNDDNDVEDGYNQSFLNYHDCDWEDDNGENISAIESPNSPSSMMRTIRTQPYFDNVERNQQQQAADNYGNKNDYYEPPNVEVCLKKSRIYSNIDDGKGDEQSINTIDGVLISPIVNRTTNTTTTKNEFGTDYKNAYNDYDNNDRRMMKNLTTSAYGGQVVETIDENHSHQQQRQRRLLKRPTQSSFSKAKATTTVTADSRSVNSITEESARISKRLEEIKDRRAKLMKRQLGKSLE